MAKLYTFKEAGCISAKTLKTQQFILVEDYQRIRMYFSNRNGFCQTKEGQIIFNGKP